MSRLEKDNRGLSIHTGFPNPATDNTQESLSLDQLLISHPVSTFFLRIQGDNWENRGIFNGDIVVVDRSLSPRHTDLVIWWLDDSFIISKLAVVPDGELWGTVISIVHRFRH